MKRPLFKHLRIENEEDFKKAVEKIPDFKVKAEKVHIYSFRCFNSFISSKVVNSMLFLNNSLANSLLNNKNFLIIPTKC